MPNPAPVRPITNLDVLIQNMSPVRGNEYAFCQIDEKAYRSLPYIPLAMFREAEGITVIIPVESVKQFGLDPRWTGTQITLNVNSSLDAVGFLARITAALAKHEISVNAFSPVSHDHIFVKPRDELAMTVLIAMSKGAV